MPNAVYSGPWIHAHKGWFTRYIFTVTDNWAMVIAFVLGVVVLYAGDRSWSLLRTRPLPGVHLISLEGSNTGVCHTCGNPSIATPPSSTEPNQQIELQDRTGSHASNNQSDESSDGHPDDSLEPRLINLRDIDFSPKDAIYACVGLGIDRPRIRMLRNECSTQSLRVALATWAAFISVTTIGLAPFIPWLATERGLETPVVLSKYTTGCGKSVVLPLIIKAVTQKAERTYLDCFTSGTCQTDEWEAALPQIHIRNATCPFEQKACSSNTQSINFEYHLLPKDLDYNSPSNLGLHRSMTCSPLELNLFSFTSTKFKHFGAWVYFKDSTGDALDSEFFAASRTLNGPNSVSRNYSGWSGSDFDARQSNKMQIDVIPRTTPSKRSALNAFHPLLRRSNATTFVLLFYAGKTSFVVAPEGPIDDPIFQATRRYSEHDKMEYLPDREITAVGCTEQYRFCLYTTSKNPQRCTGWIGSLVEDFYNVTKSGIEFADALQRFDDGSEVDGIDLDLFLLYNFIFTKGSVSAYMRRNLKFIIANSRQNGRSVKFINRSQQWMQEMEAIFATSLLAARLGLHSITAKSTNGNDFSRDLTNDRDFCGRLLFRDGNYTNFNTAALILFFAIFSIPIIWSQYNKNQRLIRKGLETVYDALKSIPSGIKYSCVSLKNSFHKVIRRCLDASPRE